MAFTAIDLLSESESESAAEHGDNEEDGLDNKELSFRHDDEDEDGKNPAPELFIVPSPPPGGVYISTHTAEWFKPHNLSTLVLLGCATTNQLVVGLHWHTRWRVITGLRFWYGPVKYRDVVIATYHDHPDPDRPFPNSGQKAKQMAIPPGLSLRRSQRRLHVVPMAGVLNQFRVMVEEGVDYVADEIEAAFCIYNMQLKKEKSSELDLQVGCCMTGSLSSLASVWLATHGLGALMGALSLDDEYSKTVEPLERLLNKAWDALQHHDKDDICAIMSSAIAAADHDDSKVLAALKHLAKMGWHAVASSTIAVVNRMDLVAVDPAGNGLVLTSDVARNVAVGSFTGPLKGWQQQTDPSAFLVDVPTIPGVCLLGDRSQTIAMVRPNAFLQLKPNCQFVVSHLTGKCELRTLRKIKAGELATVSSFAMRDRTWLTPVVAAAMSHAEPSSSSSSEAALVLADTAPSRGYRGVTGVDFTCCVSRKTADALFVGALSECTLPGAPTTTGEIYTVYCSDEHRGDDLWVKLTLCGTTVKGWDVGRTIGGSWVLEEKCTVIGAVALRCFDLCAPPVTPPPIEGVTRGLITAEGRAALVPITRALWPLIELGDTFLTNIGSQRYLPPKVLTKTLEDSLFAIVAKNVSKVVGDGESYGIVNHANATASLLATPGAPGDKFPLWHLDTLHGGPMLNCVVSLTGGHPSTLYARKRASAWAQIEQATTPVCVGTGRDLSSTSATRQLGDVLTTLWTDLASTALDNATDYAVEFGSFTVTKANAHIHRSPRLEVSTLQPCNVTGTGVRLVFNCALVPLTAMKDQLKYENEYPFDALRSGPNVSDLGTATFVRHIMAGFGMPPDKHRVVKLAALLQESLRARGGVVSKTQYLRHADEPPVLEVELDLFASSDPESESGAVVGDVPEPSTWQCTDLDVTVTRAISAGWLVGTILPEPALATSASLKREQSVIVDGEGSLSMKGGKPAEVTNVKLKKGVVVSVPAGYQCVWTVESTITRYWQSLNETGDVDAADMEVDCDICEKRTTTFTTYQTATERMDICTDEKCSTSFTAAHAHAVKLGTLDRPFLPQEGVFGDAQARTDPDLSDQPGISLANVQQLSASSASASNSSSSGGEMKLTPKKRPA